MAVIEAGFAVRVIKYIIFKNWIIDVKMVLTKCSNPFKLLSSLLWGFCYSE